MPKFYFPTQSHWVQLGGPDAADFLHRLTTVNIHALEVGQGARGAFLNAQGKFRASFTLWNLGDAFGLETVSREHLLIVIEQCTFSEKMTVTPIDDLMSVWIFEDSISSHSRMLAMEDGVRICNQGTLDFGIPFKTIWGLPEIIEPWMLKHYGEKQSQKDILSSHDLLKLRIEACRPAENTEIVFETGPLEVGAPDFVALNKGCYPGQEIIEKIQALGSPAKRLVQIEGEITQSLQPGSLPISAPIAAMNVAEPPTEVGTITSLWTDQTRFKALALVRKNYINPGLEVTAYLNGALALRGKIIKVAPFQ